MKRRRQAFTLIEALVCFAIAGLIIANVWMIYGASHRHRYSADLKLQGVQRTVIFTERFELDCRRLFVDHDHPITILPPPRTGIEFCIFSTTGQLSRIAYTYDNNTSTISRTVDSTQERLPGNYEQLRFRLVEHPNFHALPPYVAEMPPAPRSGGRIEYLVTAIPTSLVSVPVEKRLPHQRTTLWGAVSAPTWLGRWKYQFWLPNPSIQ